MKLLVFWRTGGTSWCCRVVVALVGLLLALPTLAQPSVQWQRYVGGDSTSETNHGTVRLSRTRFVTTGRWISTDFQTAYPLLVFTRSTGDTIRVIRLTTMPETSFSAIAAADSGDFYALGNSGYDSTFTILGGGTDIICRFDSLGRPKWRRFPVHPPGIGSAYYRVVPLPDGALIVATAPSVVPGQLGRGDNYLCRNEFSKINSEGIN